MKRVCFCCALLLLLGVAGCTRFGRGVRREPDLVGLITEVQTVQSTQVAGRILVERTINRGDGPFQEPYWVTLQRDTPIYVQRDSSLRPGSFAGLRVGQEVQVWFAGPVRESFPMQVDARQVTILDVVP